MVFLLESHLYLSLKALDSPLRNTSECCYTQWFSMSCRCPGPSYFNSLSTLKNCYKCAVYIKYTCKLLITYTFLNSIIRIIYLFLENFFLLYRCHHYLKQTVSYIRAATFLSFWFCCIAFANVYIPYSNSCIWLNRELVFVNIFNVLLLLHSMQSLLCFTPLKSGIHLLCLIIVKINIIVCFIKNVPACMNLHYISF